MNVHIFTQADRNAPRVAVALLVGKHVVIRRPIPRTPYHTYTTMDGDTPVWSIMSHPDPEDCERAIRQHRASNTGDSTPPRRPARRAIAGATRAKRGAL